MRMILTTCLALLALPVQADIDAVINDHILTRHATFSQSATALADAAQTDCTPAGTIPAYHAAFDAWIGVSHIRFGPIEDGGEGLAIVFWPDKKGMIPRALSRLISAEDPVVNDAEKFAKYSIAVRGFFALEQLLFDPAFSQYEKSSYSCALSQAITLDMARIAIATHADWSGGFASTLRQAGMPGNKVFLTDKEGAQALFTSLLGGLEFIYRQRIGRPLGSFEKPRPKRAEARRSLRSVHNIVVSLDALQEMAAILADGEAPETMEAFGATLRYAKSLDDRVFENLHEISAKFQLSSLQEMIAIIHESVAAEIGSHLGVVAGFNALDGD